MESVKWRHLNHYLMLRLRGRKLPEDRSGKTTPLTIILVVVAIIFVVAIVILLQTSNGSNQVKVVIDYSGAWSGSLGNFGSPSPYNGTGSHTYTIEQNGNAPLDVSAAIQKSDNNSNTLTVSIESMDGVVLATGNTNEAYGVVNISWIDS
jgi:hypothetical protein